MPNLLSLVVWMPLVGAAALVAWPASRERAAGVATALWAVAVLAVTGALARYDVAAGGLQFVEDREWIPTLGARYTLAADGLSVVLAITTALVTAVAVSTAVHAGGRHRRGYLASMLALETAVLGALLSADLLLLYAFWAAALVPALALVALWGDGHRGRAASGFLLSAAVGAAVLLIAVLALYAVSTRATTIAEMPAVEVASAPLVGSGAAARAMLDTAFASIRSGTGTLNVYALQAVAGARLGSSAPLLPVSTQAIVFALLVAACAARGAVFPFHAWLRSTAESAPCAAAAMLVGAFAGVGGFGLIRLALPLAPEAARNPRIASALCALGAAGLVWGALGVIHVAASSCDVRRLVASYCVAQSGLVALGCFATTPAGIAGAAFVTATRGIVVAALLAVAAKGGDLRRLGPRARALALVLLLAAAAVPPFGSFVAASTAVAGALAAGPVRATAGAVGCVFLAAGLVGLFARIAGAAREPDAPRLGTIRVLCAVAVVAALTTVGVLPRPALDLLRQSAQLVAYQVWHVPGTEDRYAPTAVQQERLDRDRANPLSPEPIAPATEGAP
jgi:NADH-quinone oxidoreductase subunit M